MPFPPKSHVRSTARIVPRGRSIALLVSCAGLLLLAACADMSHIDARIDRVLADRTDRINAGDTAPSRRFGDPEGRAPRSLYEKTPATNNPGAEDLVFDPAPRIAVEDRLIRLEEYADPPDDGRRLTLEDALRVAQTSAREYLTAEEDYILAAIRLLIEQHRWGPRFFNDTTLSVDANPLGDGSYQAALNVINTFRATQRLPYGGELEARLITQATEQLRNVVAGRNYEQSSALILSGTIPLLRDAGLVAQEDLIQSERDLVYAARDFEGFRREFFVSIATDYFDLVLQQADIANQGTRLASIEQLQAQTAAFVEAGRLRTFELNNVRQNFLRSQDSLTSSRERYILALDRFKIRLGIPVEENVILEPVALDPPEPDITPERAGLLALDYRLDLQNLYDQVNDARRAIEIARNQLLPDLNVSAGVTFNTPPDERAGGLDFDGDETELTAAATLSLPLDREIERLNLRTATIRLEQSQRSYEQFRDTVVLEARQSVREINRAIFSVELQDESVRLNELRQEEQRIKADQIDAQTRLDAENDLLNARNARDQAVRDLRVAILNHLLDTGQLRVDANGAFVPLPGMQVGAASPPQETVIPAVPAPPP